LPRSRLSGSGAGAAFSPGARLASDVCGWQEQAERAYRSGADRLIDFDRAASSSSTCSATFEPGGRQTLGNDVSLLRRRPPYCRRRRGRHVVIRRSPAGPSAAPRHIGAVASLRIGAAGPMGRILVRGEPGHDIIPELYPAPGEPVIDKPGKGAFYQTDLELMLKNREIDTLFVCGVTTEVCVNTTVREANDRGFRCIVLSDCCTSYFPEFHAAGLAMIKAQGGIFGWVSASSLLLAAMDSG
jgi:nicotinamidase-related amidase